MKINRIIIALTVALIFGMAISAAAYAFKGYGVVHEVGVDAKSGRVLERSIEHGGD
jgi:hypothetical protein